MVASDKTARIGDRLLAWYDRHARELPWRMPPASREMPDPYRVWLSEIMLQQTTVAAVTGYFAAFVERWPTIEALAAADDADVLSAWAGLGYYARARNLIACARVVAGRGGRFPDSEAELRALPGIGAYTAAAIAAIAFDRRAAVVDANIARVVARLFAMETPLPAARLAIRDHVERITPDERAGDFAQAMMDLGATVCKPRDPECPLCPLSADCAARAKAIAAELPRKLPKKPQPRRKGMAFWIERDGCVLLVKRPGRGMLAGMRALPDDGWSVRADGHGTPPFSADWSEVEGAVSHVFTHFQLDLALWRTDMAEVSLDGEWWPIVRLAEAGLPTLFARASRLVIGGAA